MRPSAMNEKVNELEKRKRIAQARIKLAGAKSRVLMARLFSDDPLSAEVANALAGYRSARADLETAEYDEGFRRPPKRSVPS